MSQSYWCSTNAIAILNWLPWGMSLLQSTFKNWSISCWLLSVEQKSLVPTWQKRKCNFLCILLSLGFYKPSLKWSVSAIIFVESKHFIVWLWRETCQPIPIIQVWNCYCTFPRKLSENWIYAELFTQEQLWIFKNSNYCQPWTQFLIVKLFNYLRFCWNLSLWMLRDLVPLSCLVLIKFWKTGIIFLCVLMLNPIRFLRTHFTNNHKYR